MKLSEDQFAEVYRFIVLYEEPRYNWYPVVRIFKVVENGALEEVYCGERSWALAARDEIAAILAELGV